MSLTKILDILKDLGVIIFGLIIALLIAEGFLRLKNSDMSNYDIEMWKYSNELKQLSDNELIGHIHKNNSSAILQSVEIRTNSLGLRGDESLLSCCDRSVLLLGSSITLGWGVQEEFTLSEVLNSKFQNKIAFLNGGIGNYNTVRYVNNYLNNLSVLKPKTIIIQYFINDAEKLSINKGNFLLKNSQLAVTLWSVYQKTKASFEGVSLEEYYKQVYKQDSQGFIEMQNALDQIKEHSIENDIRIIVAMTPDIHSMNPYKFNYIHDIIEKESYQRGFEYIDLLDSFLEIDDSVDIFAMPGDPHPNKIGHKVMAEQIYAYLTENAL